MQPFRLAAALEHLRAHPPLVHNITNYVAMDVSANALLALGAAPAMIHATEEAAAFAELASSLVLNIGTLSPRWAEGMALAQRAALDKGAPIVLDPVGAGATPYRTAIARQLLEGGVTVVRGNASEILALVGEQKPRGVDSVHTPLDALAVAQHVARTHGCLVAATGEIDIVTDGVRTVRVEGGHVWLTKVTALGCALSAAVAAFVASSDEPLVGTAAALALWSVAAERAAAGAEGPGSFRVRFLDALATVTPAELGASARVHEGEVAA
jgi:hydroxyethylthiazole kinase